MTITVNADALDLSRYIKRGDRIVWGQACGEPTTLVEALIAQAESIGDLSAFTSTSFSGLLNADAASKFTLSSMGAIGALRSVAAVNKLQVIPCHVSQIASFIEEGLIGCDVAFVQVSPANEKGEHSFGLITDVVQTMVREARVVIAEVNDQVPFTQGVMLPASEIDVAVHVSRAPVAVQPAKIGETDEAIARIAANYIVDGSVIQVGIGATPDAILRLLSDRRDLGVHSGMMGDSLIDLIEAGVITNARKEIDAGVSITGALIGTKKLYDFAHSNPKIGMRPSSYTHDGNVLAKLSKLVTINSAMEVDLSGQVNAEQSGLNYMGGTGGQVDYVRAGGRSKGGRSIMALQATAKGGTLSKITTALSGPVTTARSDVDVVVTEFGSAELKGQTLAERARRLVQIAHPNFREELDKAAFDIKKRGF